MFEVVGEVTDIQVIASGRGINRLKHLRKRHGADDGENSKERRRFGSIMEPFAELRFTGMKRMASASVD
jgi:hypothetical protein